jgi:hypothetical protein
MRFYPEVFSLSLSLSHVHDSTLFLASKQALFCKNTALVLLKEIHSPQTISVGNGLLQLVMTAVQLPDQQSVPLQHGGKLDLHCRPLCCSSNDLLLRPLQLSFQDALLSVLQNKLESDRKKIYTLLTCGKNQSLLSYQVAAQGD